MNRAIKFRGKLTTTGKEGDGEWVYGYYVKITGRHYIIPDYADCDWQEEDVWEVQGLLEVIPETVGEFTGLHDKNGKEIYEGDITNFWSKFRKREFTARIYWNEKKAKFNLKNPQGKVRNLDNICQPDWYCEVIGNIHEHHELLEANQ